jgi:hypothetical protein
VAPSGTKTLGDIVSFAASLLTSVTVTPPGGAGVPNVIGNGAVCPSPTVAFDGRPMAPGNVTVTLAVALATPTSPEVAVIVAVPTPLAVTGTFMLVTLAGIVIDAGTVATPELLELRLTVKPPAGATAERLREMFWVPVPVIVRLGGKNPSVAVTCTNWLVEAKPVADAVIVAEGKSRPVTVGVTAEVVCPSGIMSAPGETRTLVESLLVRVTKTPPEGAGVASVIGKFANCPNPTDALAGRMIPLCTETAALASGILGRALA